MPDLAKDAERAYLDLFHAQAAPIYRFYEAERAAIATPEQWWERRNQLKAIFIDGLGGLPLERTPLNPRVLGSLDRGAFVLERVIFESLPGVVVTSNLYVPKGLTDPAPAVLVVCGHSANGKLYVPYQQVCTGLASKGYVVLTFDPIGQGERTLYVEDGRLRLPSCTEQHTHLGVQLATTATSLARQMVWDSMRALDYLESRPEVDPGRLGMTGCSGGGTNTTYVGALDERLAATVPVCYVTSREAYQAREEIADYEQNIYGQLARGLDFHEYVAMVAPRAVCIGAATEDFFPLAGAQEAHAAARHIFEVLGIPEKCEIAIAEGTHGFQPELRHAAYRWFNLWLEQDADDADPEFDLPDDAELCCFPDGVPAEHTHRAVLHDVRPRAEELSRFPMSADELRAELSAQAMFLPDLVSVGEWSGDDDIWDVAEVQASSAPPILVARRTILSPSAVAVIPDLDALRSPEAATDAAIVLPVSCMPDLAERAELLKGDGPTFPWIHGREAYLAFYAEFLGRDAVYLRTGQILSGLHALGARAASLTAKGTLATPALYAAFLSTRVASLRLVRPLWSYAMLLALDLHVLGPAEVPWGVLGSHDLPEVMALLAPRPLTIEKPLGPDGVALTPGRLEGLAEVGESYAEAGAAEAFKLSL